MQIANGPVYGSMYAGNEEALAQWFKKTGKRNEIFLASKFGYVPGSKTLEIDSSPEYCKKACERTLKALGIDCIDLCTRFPINGNIQ